MYTSMDVNVLHIKLRLYVILYIQNGGAHKAILKSSNLDHVPNFAQILIKLKKKQYA